VGEHQAADRAFRLSLLSQPRTSFVVDWPRAVPIGDGTIPDFSDGSWQLNRLVALRAMGEPIVPAEFADDAVRALAHALIGERSEAEELVTTAIEENPAEPRTWDIAIVLRDAWGQPVEDELRVASVVRGRSFPARQAVPRVVTISSDVAIFRAYPGDGLVMAAVRTFTDPPYPWLLAELLP
jgi:hypothetical protein